MELEAGDERRATLRLHVRQCEPFERDRALEKNANGWITNATYYLEKGITYDRNGDMQTLYCTGNGMLLDNLAYTYTSNRLTNNTYDMDGDQTSITVCLMRITFL